ncbi:MAG: NUDIX hydrolase [Desulfobacterium sp.]|nr:NUDIX hydrolase [Desulfobacterium sp.]
MTIKIIKADKLTEYDHLNLFSISYLDQDQNKRSWYIASRHQSPKCITQQFQIPDGVIIVPYHVGIQKLVVIKEFRVVLGDYKYGFPAGLVDKGETIEETSKRELKEETGLELTRFLKIGPPVFSSTGMTDESVAIVYVECTGDFSSKGNSSSEDIQTLFVSKTEASELCQNADLKFDVKTWLVLTSFAKTGMIG